MHSIETSPVNPQLENLPKKELWSQKYKPRQEVNYQIGLEEHRGIVRKILPSGIIIIHDRSVPRKIIFINKESDISPIAESDQATRRLDPKVVEQAIASRQYSEYELDDTASPVGYNATADEDEPDTKPSREEITTW